MKKLITIITALCLCAVAFFGGCISGRDGVDGKNGEDVSIYEIYEAVNTAREEEGLETLTFLEFISEYLSYDSEELSTATSLKTAMNRSLMSSVSILSEFTYTVRSSTGKLTYNELYAGSGVIISVDKDAGDAYVVTNCHVIYSSSSDEVYCEDVHVYLYGKETHSLDYENDDKSKFTVNDGDWGMTATVVAASITYDLAVLKIEGSETIKNSEVYAASFTSDDILDVGETVYAVGNSEGEGISVTTGIITKDSEYISLSLEDDTSYISSSDYNSYRVVRTDAAINSGNSGGGLFNSNGEIVGIVNAKDTSSDVDNMGYAIPASTARRVIANMLASEGEVAVGDGLYRALLGITVTSDIVDTGLDSDGTAYITEAVAVYSIETDSLAYGVLQENDIITHIKISGTDGTVREDNEVTRRYILIESMISARVGDVVTLTVKRDGAYTDYDFTITQLSQVS